MSAERPARGLGNFQDSESGRQITQFRCLEPRVEVVTREPIEATDPELGTEVLVCEDRTFTRTLCDR